MKKHLSQVLKTTLLLLVMLVIVQANAQKRYAPLAVGDIRYTIENDVQLSPNVLQFDLYLLDTDASSPFELSIIQAGILVSSSILGGGTISVSLVSGFSGLVASQIPTSVLWVTGAANGCIKMTPRTGPGAGSGTIISTTGLGTPVARIKITNTVPFPSYSHANLNFNFTTSPYPTKVFSYISGTSTAVTTTAANCFQGTTYYNIPLNPPLPPTLFNVVGGGSYCVGGAGLPVGLDGSQTGVTYTLYKDLLATAITFAGTGAAFTFAELQLGTHTYTVKAVGAGGPADMLGSAVITENVCTPTWSGLVSSDYHDCYNWVGGVAIPSPTDDVIIPDGCPNYPELNPGEFIHCHNMDIGSAIKSTLLAPGMGIAGEFIVDGNLTVKASATVTVFDGGWVTINGNLINQGTFMMESGSSMITNGTVSGSATVKRDIPANLGWHLLSSPVGYQEICNGAFAPTLANFPGDIQTWDFYKWLSNCAPEVHWRNLRNADLTVNTADFGSPPSFVVTKGYLVAYGAGFPATKSFYGNPNTGDKVCDFSGIISDCSWELAGNPFPSAVDWNLVTGKSNLVADYYYVWNELKTGGPGYEFFKDLTHLSSTQVNGYIPSMQGFFVKVDPNGIKTLGLPNSSRVHDTDHWLKNNESADNKLSLVLSNGINADEAFVMFENNNTTGKDRNDAEKMFSMSTTVPQVYTLVNNDVKTALNAMPFVTDGTTIPVGFVAPAEGNYSITVSGIESFASLTGLSLEDLQLNYTQNLLLNPVYNFTATGNEDAGRFLLHFAGAIGMGEKNNSTINIYSSEKNVFITCAAGFRNATVTVSNLLGQEVLTRKLNDQTTNQVTVNALKGYYIVKVQNETTVKTAKVYINE